MHKATAAFISIQTIKQNIGRVEEQLSSSALAKAERFVREEDRLLSLGGSLLLEKFAGPLDKLKYGPDGKPCFDAGEGPFFNISHSVDLAGILVSDEHEVGLDIEKIRPGFSDLQDFCLSEEERESGEDFLKLFTAKESLCKAIGTGLTDEIKTVPAIPLEGRIQYCNRIFYRNIIYKEGYYIFAAAAEDEFYITEAEINV